MMGGFDPAAAAAILLAGRRARAGLAPLAAPPASIAEGIAAQVALAGLCGAVPPAGFKIGATAPRMQAYLGLDGPAAGFMARAGLHGSGTVQRFDAFFRPGVECELAVRLDADLPPGPCTQERAADAVGQLFAAIEIVENRYPPLPQFGTPALIADQVFHAAAVLGDPCPRWRSIELAAVAGELLVDGAVRDRGVGGDLLGHPMAALAWLAGSREAAAFGGLRAGQVVMLGSVTPPLWLDGPAVVTVRFTGMSPVAVRFSGAS